MAFVFWQNVASRHQRDLLRAIAAASGQEVICAVEGNIPGDRAAFGWGGEDFEPVKLVRSDDCATFDTLVARRDDIHVLTGFLYHPVIADAFQELSRSRRKILLHSESVDTHGIKGALRTARDRLKASRARDKIHGVLAIGELGVGYFKRLGFSPDRIVPFGYFVDAPTSNETHRKGAVSFSRFRIVYSGQFIPRKNLEALVEALGSLNDLEWTLDMIGSGPLEEMLRVKATNVGIAGRIAWHGPVSPDAIPGLLLRADLLVLPSRWDGWGVVVNEALAAGVPVVCSDRCGAACVLTDPRVGETFPAGDGVMLAGILRRRIGAGPVSSDVRASCIAVAETLSADAGARQFLDGLGALDSGLSPPPAPWLRSSCSPQFQHS